MGGRERASRACCLDEDERQGRTKGCLLGRKGKSEKGRADCAREVKGDRGKGVEGGGGRERERDCPGGNI